MATASNVTVAWNNFAASMIPAVQQFNVALTNFGTAITQTVAQMQPLVQAVYPYQTGYLGGGTVNVTDYHAYWNGVEVHNGNVRQLTPEERLARERRDRAARKQRREASKRGAKLLLRLLDDRQQREYAATRMFTMVAADGRIFRLRKGRTAELLDVQGNVLASFCIHLYGGYVEEDTLICQKMMLDTEPAEFDRIANISWHRKPPVVAPNVVPLRRAA